MVLLLALSCMHIGDSCVVRLSIILTFCIYYLANMPEGIGTIGFVFKFNDYSLCYVYVCIL